MVSSDAPPHSGQVNVERSLISAITAYAFKSATKLGSIHDQASAMTVNTVAALSI